MSVSARSSETVPGAAKSERGEVGLLFVAPSASGAGSLFSVTLSPVISSRVCSNEGISVKFGSEKRGLSVISSLSSMSSLAG
ncbi:MAG TPA: hypothetical protein DER68_06175 [Ruminococcaceae bacterium]|nr:hypothetical protein [Oscillospiraceae bacterium]